MYLKNITFAFNIFLTIFASTNLQAENFEKYLSDPAKKVPREFKIRPALYDRVRFWYKIYTEYNSRQGLVHDNESFGLIYSTLDTTEIFKDVSNIHERNVLDRKHKDRYLKKYKDAMLTLSRKRCTDKYCLKIVKALKKAHIRIPKNWKKRKKLFLNLRKNVRIQTGQKDMIKSGLVRINKYKKTLDKIFKSHKLPPDLIAISLLESSFNLKARSKVNATGPWQFMRHVGKYFMKIDRSVDQRNNPFLSTSSALHLLRQNKMVLKHWDLAINAYNSGTGNIRKGIKKVKALGIKRPRVEHLIKHFKHPAFKFAGKNFYSEFLALVYVMRYKDKIFKNIKKPNTKPIKLYVSKCKIKIRKKLEKIKSSSYNLKTINNHLKKRSATYPKGTVVFSDVKLSNKRYKELPARKYISYFPKKINRYVKRDHCVSN